MSSQKTKKAALQAVLPAAINVLGKTFTVQVTSLKGLHGDCNPDTGVIRIHQNLTPETAQMTLFHEAVHAAFAQSGQNEMLKEGQEEALVRMIENSFYHIVNVSKLSVDAEKTD